MNFTVLMRQLQGSGKRFRVPGFIFLLLSLLVLGACGDLEETPAELETAGLGEALEAEHARIRTNFVRQSSADASAGRYLTQAAWAKNTHKPQEEATLSFTVPSKKTLHHVGAPVRSLGRPGRGVHGLRR